MTEAIWLDPALAPDAQRTWRTVFDDKNGCAFCTAEFRRAYDFGVPVKSARVKVFADTKYWLFANGAFAGMGPVCAGGDYGSVLAMPKQYASAFELAGGETLELFARVQLSPEVMTDSSVGRGGFWLEGEAALEDGRTVRFASDEGWQARVDSAYRSARNWDGDARACAWSGAKAVPMLWNIETSPIPNLEERFVKPLGADALSVMPGETGEITLLFDKIYAGYLAMRVEASGRYEIELTPFELEDQPSESERLAASRDANYRGLRMHSVGGYRVRAKNAGGHAIRLSGMGLIASRYPGEPTGAFACSDASLEKVYEVSRWTLGICRQSLHLDSPRHQETLGCTGDYYVESLMTYMTYGDARLVRLDLVRTADWLTRNGGAMFHTSYSLIWVMMLWDYYRFTGDKTIFAETRDALSVLMARFAGYVGENGLIENAPNYMFVDWRVIDGYTMHHPPKALGQTCLCAFYAGALDAASAIWSATGDQGQADEMARRAKKMREAVNERLFDAKSRLYIAGLDTPAEPNRWQPENPKKTYFIQHANVLAALYGFCEGERARDVLRRALSASDEEMLDMQPYFMHFALEAVWKADLFGEWGLKLLRRWVPMVEACDKGLQEGWYSPGGYSFDHSHAWGGTPAYQLPARLAGLEILEPGMAKLLFKPRLYGLKSAEIAIPTPRGVVRVAMREGQPPDVRAPEGVRVTLE